MAEYEDCAMVRCWRDGDGDVVRGLGGAEVVVSSIVYRSSSVVFSISCHMSALIDHSLVNVFRCCLGACLLAVRLIFLNGYFVRSITIGSKCSQPDLSESERDADWHGRMLVGLRQQI